MFNESRSDGNLEAALGPACNQINRMIKQLGDKKHTSPAEPHTALIEPEPRRQDESPSEANIPVSEGGAVDLITRFAIEIANRAAVRLAPELRPPKHSRWAGEYKGARYYRLWHRSRPWHTDQFRFQLWLESGARLPSTLWVGFSMRPAWLAESGYPAEVALELRRALDKYAKKAGIAVIEEGAFVGINYELRVPALTESVVENAAQRLCTIITALSPVIAASLLSPCLSAPARADSPMKEADSQEGNIRLQLRQGAIEGEVDSKLIADVFGMAQNWVSGRACQQNAIGRPVLAYKRNHEGDALTGKDGRYRYSLDRVLSFVDALETWVSSSEDFFGVLPLWSATDPRIQTGQVIPLGSIVKMPGMPASFSTVKKRVAPPVAFCFSSAGQGYSLLYPAERLERLREAAQDLSHAFEDQ